MKRWLLALLFFVAITLAAGATMANLATAFGGDPYQVGYGATVWATEAGRSVAGFAGELVAVLIVGLAPPILTFWASLALATRVTRRRA